MTYGGQDDSNGDHQRRGTDEEFRCTRVEAQPRRGAGAVKDQG
jgi:hypothetical protein